MPVPYDTQFLGTRGPPLVLPVLRGGNSSNADIAVLDYVHYTVLFDAVPRYARVSACNIDGRRFVPVARAAHDTWLYDARVAAAAQTGDACYRGSGLDRGHLTRDQQRGVYGFDV